MFDTHSSLFSVRLPLWWRDKHKRPIIVTVWHQDPATDGTDSSCGWFPRARHGDEAVLKEIEKKFLWEARDGAGAMYPWFSATGDPTLSTRGIVTDMFFTASIVVLGSRRRAVRFMRRNHFEIMHFAENSCDSLHCSIQGVFGQDREKIEDRVKSWASCVYGWIIRETRPWWRHPRWHVHHWAFTFPWLKRRGKDRCASLFWRDHPRDW